MSNSLYKNILQINALNTLTGKTVDHIFPSTCKSAIILEKQYNISISIRTITHSPL